MSLLLSGRIFPQRFPVQTELSARKDTDPDNVRSIRPPAVEKQNIRKHEGGRATVSNNSAGCPSSYQSNSTTQSETEFLGLSLYIHTHI